MDSTVRQIVNLDTEEINRLCDKLTYHLDWRGPDEVQEVIDRIAYLNQCVREIVGCDENSLSN